MDGNPIEAPSLSKEAEDVEPLWQMMVVQFTDDGDSALTVIQEENDDVSCLKISSEEIDVVWNGDDDDEDEDEVICHLSQEKLDDVQLSKEDFSFLECNSAAMAHGISPDDEDEPKKKMKKKAPVPESITSSVPLLSYPMGHLPVTAIPPLKASSCGHLAPYVCRDHEPVHPEFSTGIGKALLSETLEQVKKSLEEVAPGYDDKSTDVNADRLRKTYMKNLLILSLSVMFVYAPFYALRNLQSSINHENGLGLISMALMGVTYIAGCLLGTGLVNRIRPKWALLFGLSGFLVYILANFHATFYTLLPATLLVGFTNANLWVAQGTYLTSIGISYAALTGKRHDHVLMLFNGTFVFFLQFSQFLGNLVCSLILGMGLSSSANEHPDLDIPVLVDDIIVSNISVHDSLPSAISTEWNTSFCGASYCHTYKIEHAIYSINAITLAVLLGIFSALCVCGMALLGFFLDKLDVIFHKSKVKVLGQILGVAHLHRHRAMLLAIPGYVFLGAQAAFVYGDFTKAFITCPFGVHMVGYVMMFFGICDSITAFINGPVQQLCGRRSILFAMAVFHLSLLVILFLWKPLPDEKILIFLIAGALGMCDATWQTQACTMCGLMFKEREAAFASFRIYESLGFTVAAGVAQFICIDVKIVLLAITLIISMASYGVLEFTAVPDTGFIPPVTV